jgi:hypothetical protein
MIGKGFGKYIHRDPHCAPKKEGSLWEMNGVRSLISSYVKMEWSYILKL